MARRVINKDGKRMRPNVVSPCGGSSKKIEVTDWSPLYGHKVLVWADSDEPGRKFAKSVAKASVRQSVRSEARLPPRETMDTTSPTQSASVGGRRCCNSSTLAAAAKRYDEVISPKELDIKEPIPANRLADTPYFRIMGMVGDKICIQSKKTHKIHQYMPGALTSDGCLLQIAPAAYWDSVAGGSQWTQAHKRAWGGRDDPSSRERRRIGSK